MVISNKAGFRYIRHIILNIRLKGVSNMSAPKDPEKLAAYREQRLAEKQSGSDEHSENQS
jgi:hypothetical protein